MLKKYLELQQTLTAHTVVLVCNVFKQMLQYTVFQDISSII